MTTSTVQIRLATRGSRLARAQTDLAIAALTVAGSVTTSVVIVETTGDRRADVPAAEMKGQGWFTSEIERSIVDGAADCAVHSAKDLPSELAAGLVVAAYLARADVRDGLITRDGATLAALAPGSRVATSSPRRAALIHAINPTVVVVPMRGNVDTRLDKLDNGEVDALVLACAGLDRIGLGARVTERLDPEVFVPAPAQGAIALETRDDNGLAEIVGAVGDAPTRATIVAERTLMVALGGGCLLPLGAWARVDGGELVLTAAIPVNGRMRRITVSGGIDAPAALGELAAWQLK